VVYPFSATERLAALAANGRPLQPAECATLARRAAGLVDTAALAGTGGAASAASARTLSAIGADFRVGLVASPHQPRKPHSSRLHHIQL